MNLYARTLALGYIHIPCFVRRVGRSDKDFVGARRKKDQRPVDGLYSCRPLLA